MSRRAVVWVFIAGLLLGAAASTGAAAVQSVLLFVGTPTSPTALTATGGALDVNIQ